MVLGALTGAIVAIMAGSREPLTPTECRSHHERITSVEPTAHDRQGVRVRAENEVTSTQVTAKHILLEDVIAEHDKQLKHQEHLYTALRSKYMLHKSEHEKMRKDHAQLHELCVNLDKQRSDLEEQCNKFQEQCGNLKKHLDHVKRQYGFAGSRYKYLIKNIVQPYAQIKDLPWDDQTKDTIDIVLDPLAIDAVEASDLRGQVRVLQKEMLARVEKSEAVTDEQFAQDFRNLAALIKTLSRTVRPIEGVNIFEALGTPVLLHGVAQHYWNTRARKKSLIEAWTWSVLLVKVFQTPFTIFGKECETLRTLWSAMFGAEHYHDWPSPSVVCETWRYTTMEWLAGGVVDTAIITKGAKKDVYNILEESVIDARATTLNTIASALSSISPTADFSEVGQIVDKAFALAMQLSSQRARLQITFPEAEAKFDKLTMSSLPDPDGEDINDGSVAFIVNPGLTKWGDAHGKNLDQRYDIVPSLVRLEITPPTQEVRQSYAGVVKRIDGAAPASQVDGKNGGESYR